MSKMKKAIIATVLGISALTAVLPMGAVVDARGVYQSSNYYKGSGYSQGMNRLGNYASRAQFQDAYDMAWDYVIMGKRPRVPAGMASDPATRIGWESGLMDATYAHQREGDTVYVGAKK